ncbi:MAG TPA: glycosyltransferase [Gemmatimonadaceae bacterium]|nr:glycosyltransferase [Gemmatimonadaceae bacterium]
MAGPQPAPLSRLLLVSDMVPGAPGVGGLYLNDLCALYPSERLACAAIGPWDQTPWPATLENAARTVIPRPPEHGFFRLGRHLHGVTRAPYENYIHSRTRRDVLPRIVEFAHQERVDAIWVPLASPTSIRIAAAAAEALDVPLRALVWDPPRFYLSEYWKLRGRALDALVDAFGTAVSRSATCGVMSDEMRTAYEAAYGARCVVMQHGIARRWWQSPATAPDHDRLTIAYAGSLYARAEWEALLRALSSVGWRVAGRDVVLRYLGPRLDVEVSSAARIEFFGWRDRAETLALLAEADVCYLPYMMAPQYAEAVRQAFPTKLTSYLAAGRPVFLHAPRLSSPASFLERYPAGVLCDTLDAAGIVNTLTKLVSDPDVYARATRAGRAALEERFDLEIFRRRFADFLEVDVDALHSIDAVP